MSKKINLSIIMPCYNCSKTLPEALQSILNSDIPVNYEVVLVNDGSTDNTEAIIAKYLHRKHFRYFAHKKNKGGGAARNTALKKARGEYILCFDSDDLLEKDAVKNMLALADEKKLDGVAFGIRRFFWKTSIHFGHNLIASFSNRPILITDLFDTNNVGINNFLYKKSCAVKVGGYPENHDLDTQDFDYRMIAAGFKIEYCPSATYFHRQAVEGGSYFDRTHKSGLFSIYYYLAIEQLLHLFSEKTVEAIIQFPVFSAANLHQMNLSNFLAGLYQADQKHFLKSKATQNNLVKKYLQAINFIKRNQFELAQKTFLSLLASGYEYELIHFNLIRSALGTGGQHSIPNLERDTIKLMSLSSLVTQQPIFANNLVMQLFNKLKKLV